MLHVVRMPCIAVQVCVWASDGKRASVEADCLQFKYRFLHCLRARTENDSSPRDLAPMYCEV